MFLGIFSPVSGFCSCMLRYLRNKTPLSEDIVKALRRNPFVNRKGHESSQRGDNESKHDIKGTVSVRTSGVGE